MLASAGDRKITDLCNTVKENAVTIKRIPYIINELRSFQNIYNYILNSYVTIPFLGNKVLNFLELFLFTEIIPSNEYIYYFR